MEKLVELLNQFEKEKIISEWWRVDEDDEYFWRSLEWWDIVNRSFDPDAHWFFKYQIISKDFKFIERLVKNDKIETNNLSLQAFKNIFGGCWFVEVSDLEVLLMLFAISDTPIEDLVSYLK